MGMGRPFLAEGTVRAEIMKGAWLRVAAADGRRTDVIISKNIMCHF